MTEIAELARRYAIADVYEDVESQRRTAPVQTLERLLAAFGVDASDPTALARAPSEADAPVLEVRKGVRCYQPPALEEGRLWGIALQLYQLRSARNWGIGDFGDLAVFARVAARTGADFVGLNPLHALFLANPAHCSPFSPSNRRFLNPLYIAVDAVEGFEAEDCDADARAAAREAALVDYPAVARLKREALGRIWQRRGSAPDGMAGFVRDGGELLRRHALFEAISETMVAEGHGAGWHGWPEAWRDPASDTVSRFAEEHHDAVAFQLWLQYLADRQLAEAREAALGAGMRIGLYLDFAVGEVPDGSSTWSDRSLVLGGLRVGAPPDYFNEAGQDWGLAPLSPLKMAAQQAAPFRQLMADATRRAGALRIDHAMALWQLFLIPEGVGTAGGTYARYPVGRMLEALAAASKENACLMIGEDLGNVPEGFREVMAAAGVLSYRILLFERDESGFIPPEDYPRQALVCLSTHDLPTFRGWWRGDDIRLRTEIGVTAAEGLDERLAERAGERAELLDDLAASGLFDGDAPVEAPPDALAVAVHRHLARAPSQLFATRLEDLAGDAAAVNLPGTSDEYPNWRPKLGITLEEIGKSELFRAITAALAAERPKNPAPGIQSISTSK
jgi:4-alpha-glucanotransferase